MNCAECTRLSDQYERLERVYAAEVALLTARQTDAVVAEYQRLHRAANEARLNADLARLELERHRRVHTKAN